MRCSLNEDLKIRGTANFKSCCAFFEVMQMTIFNLFSLLGGLGMFLYGMKVMGDNLEKCAGGKLEKILEKLTSNKYKGILLGTFITAIIQSSGAITVMLVGFVNSGIMQLEQTVGVIMGSSIGTTITAWILSLSGIGGSSILLQLVKPEHFSPLLIFIGGIMILFFHKDHVKNIGRIMMGFGLLMYGMSVMTVAMSPLSESETFRNILLIFVNPFFGVIAGIVLTTILQSSSASVGVLQALAATGAISFNTAIPILIGQNIGACSTALISSINAGTKAKQTAFIQLYFKVIGALIFLISYYLLNAIFHFAFVDHTINVFQIAIIHTVFSIVSTIIMLPFTNQLIQLAEKTIREKEPIKKSETPIEVIRIDERLLKTPDIAIEQCRNALQKMIELSLENIDLCLNLLKQYTDKNYELINENENKIDDYEDILATALSKISALKTTLETSHTVSLFLHAINDIERIGDHAVNIAESGKKIHIDSLTLSSTIKNELQVIRNLLTDIIATTFHSFQSYDEQIAEQIEPMEEVMDYLARELKNRTITRMQNNECTVQMGIICLDILNDFERISDHCSNLAIYVVQSNNDNYAVHEYSNNLKDANLFKSYYSELLDKYTLSFEDSHL